MGNQESITSKDTTIIFPPTAIIREDINYINNNGEQIQLNHVGEDLFKDITTNGLECRIVGLTLEEAIQLYPKYQIRAILIDNKPVSVHQNLSQKRINVAILDQRIDYIISFN